MMANRSRLIISLLCVLFASCVVRSVYPWLGDESLKSEPRLIGAWHDSGSDMEVYIAGDGGGEYKAVVMEKNNRTTHLVVKHYALGGDAFLVVSPAEKESVEDFVTIPGHVMMKVVFIGDRMNVHLIEMDDIEERLNSSDVQLRAVGNEKDGIILFSETAALEKFVNEQIAMGDFFDDDPVYRFARSR